MGASQMRAFAHFVLLATALIVIDQGDLRECEGGKAAQLTKFFTTTVWGVLFAVTGVALALINTAPAPGQRRRESPVGLEDGACLMGCCARSTGVLAGTRTAFALVASNTLSVAWAVIFFLGGEPMAAYIVATVLNLLNVVTLIMFLQFARAPMANIGLFVPCLALGIACDAYSMACV